VVGTVVNVAMERKKGGVQRYWVCAVPSLVGVTVRGLTGVRGMSVLLWCGEDSSGPGSRADGAWDAPHRTWSRRGKVGDVNKTQAQDWDRRQDDLTGLVGEWLDWSQASEILGVSVSKVRQMIREHQLAAVVPAPGAGQQIPAELLVDGVVVKGVPGVLTVLHDAGYDDREALGWLFTADDTLPGRPIDALRENRGSEVKRRAQAMGF
jgi:hypothetical protein